MPLLFIAATAATAVHGDGTARVAPSGCGGLTVPRTADVLCEARLQSPARRDVGGHGGTVRRAVRGASASYHCTGDTDRATRPNAVRRRLHAEQHGCSWNGTLPLLLALVIATMMGVSDDTARIMRMLMPQRTAMPVACPVRQRAPTTASADPSATRRARAQTYVVYFQQASERDFTGWLRIATCLKVWDLDVRGSHRGLFRLWWNGHQVRC